MGVNKAFKGYYKQSKSERWEILTAEYPDLPKQNLQLPENIADQMIENYLTNYEIPLGIAVNFTINRKNYVVPMAVEEPSVIAAASNAAKQFSNIKTSYGDREITGQVILYGIEDIKKAQVAVESKVSDLIDIAKFASQSMVNRGGGPKKITTASKEGDNHIYLVVYLTFNPCDAMGANAMNTVLEAITPELEKISGGTALMSILSNYSESAVAKAEVVKPIAELAEDSDEANEIAQALAMASDYAQIDVYRATTHNKGIMNGIDGVALATGNDWRAIEASAHAYASRTGTYQGLSQWKIDSINQTLVGSIEIPLPVATVGGTLSIHPTSQWALALLQNPSASELAEIMAAVGLVQNFAAIKALVTEGIQKGHMGLQARSLAIQVGAKTEEIPLVVSRLKQEEFMNRASAIKILKDIRQDDAF